MTSRSRMRSIVIWSRMPLLERGVVDALLAQPVAQLLGGHLVGRRDVGDRALDLAVVHLDAVVARIGHEHALLDQRVERLLAQLAGRRLGAALLDAFLLQLGQAHRHFVVGDRFGVDHRDEEVGRPGGRLDARQRAELAHAGRGHRRDDRRLFDLRDRRAGGGVGGGAVWATTLAAMPNAKTAVTRVGKLSFKRCLMVNSGSRPMRRGRCARVGSRAHCPSGP